MRKIIFLLFTLCFTWVNAQSGDSIISATDSTLITRMSTMDSQIGYTRQMPNIIHPSPISQNFIRYANYTPNLSTGTVSIPIPLYNLKVGDVTLPFALQYATNGIKVYDSPYPVGYGWSLQPALRITRTILGRADEHFTREYRPENANAEFPIRHKYLESLGGPADKSDVKDAQYDVFTVNLPHESFHFIIDWDPTRLKYVATTAGTNSQVELIPYDGRYGIKQIKVTDDKGVIYIFGNDFNSREEISGYITTWGLNQINLPGQQGMIKLDWSKHMYNPGPLYSETYMFKDAWQTNEHAWQTNVVDNRLSASNGSSPLPLSFISFYSDYIRLEKVECFIDRASSYPTSEITFEYDSDPLSPDLLTALKIKENTQNKVVKSVFMGYEKNNRNYLLTSVQIPGEGNYTFKYNSNRFPQLKWQASRDYWGFFNGKNNSIPQVPRTKVKSSTKRETYIFEMGDGDMEPDEDYIQANLLTKATYPTGGYSEFEYEMHRFDGKPQSLYGFSIPSFTKGGGVRIKQIKNVPGNNQPSVVKKYTYGKAENGKGIATAEPTRDTFFDIEVGHFIKTSDHPFENYIFYTHTDYRRTILNSFSSYTDFLVLGQPAIWYDEVHEYTNNANKTRYKYLYETYAKGWDFTSTYNACTTWNGTLNNAPTKLFPGFYNTMTTPLLTEKVIYKKETSGLSSIFIPLQKESYKYKTEKIVRDNLKSMRNIVSDSENRKPDRLFATYSDGTLNVNYGYAIPHPVPREYSLFDDHIYSHLEYRLELAKEYLIEESVVLYQGNDSIEKTTQYQYVDGYGHVTYATNFQKINLALKEKKISYGPSKTLTEVYLYPWEDLSEISADKKMQIIYLIAGNRVGTPIRLQQYNNDILTGQKTIQYKNFRSGIIKPEKEFYKVDNTPEVCRVQYHSYDSYGNPAHIALDDSMDIIYLWSYNGQYPIAEIKGATYLEVVAAVQSVFGATDINALTETVIPDEVKLKNGSLQRALPGALVKTYTYQPLIGMLTATDPSCITIHYNYDNYGRLQESYYYDENNNKCSLESYQYNYKN